MSSRSVPAPHVFLAGVGSVGSALLGQIREARGRGPRGGGPGPVVVAGLADSRGAVVRPGGVDLAGWRDALAEGDADLGSMVDAALREGAGPAVFVDCTADEGPVRHYRRLLQGGVSVVCANKRGVAGDLELYRRLRRAARPGGGRGGWYYETTVGAGLPVVRTLRELRATGDRVRRVEGVLSGSLAFVFDAVTEGEAFSAAVREARDRGLTEPDPREDLSGRDVARKAVVVGRETGLAIDLGDVAVEGVLPARGRGDGAGWDGMPVEAFLDGLAGVDDDFERRRKEAERDGRRLRYLARIEEDDVRVGLRAVTEDHPAWGLDGADNLIAVSSRRYSPRPLVVRGPGAGPEVTAGGVFADVLRAAAERGSGPTEG